MPYGIIVLSGFPRRGHCQCRQVHLGAGSYTHGQLLIYADIVGLYNNFSPKFVKKYADMGGKLLRVFTDYCKDVRAEKFPVDSEHSHNITETESEEFKELWRKSSIKAE